VHDLAEQPVVLNAEEEPIPQPPHMQLTARCLDSKGAFLMDAGEHMTLLVCPGVSPFFLNEALGVRDYASISDEMYELPVLDNSHNQRLHQFINHLNDEKPFAATLHVIRDNSPNRIEFFERLIEDRVENALSYHEFMQHLKTQVK
jgi:protein transport protein SEC24